MKKIGSKWLALGFVLFLTVPLTACNGNSGTDKLEKNEGAIHCFTDEVMAYSGYDKAKANLAMTELSLRLLEENIAAGGEEKNILISPASIITALGMTTYGAKGETLAQMESVFGISRAELNAYNSDYLDKLSPEVKMANSIWFTNDERLTVNDAFLQFNEEAYGTDIYESAFNDTTLRDINKWVEEKTDGMIKNILDEIPTDAVMYLINALAFEAEWENKYDSTQIWEDAKFTTSTGEEQKVDMMRSEEWLYLSDEEATGFIKRYKGGNYAFAALLPNEGVTVTDYVKNLTGEHLQSMLANPYKNAMVYAHLPQFSCEYDVEMSELLKAMGMTDAFNSGLADFTAMATSTHGNIFISRVIHKTFIEVSPVGTKAGAATVVEAMDESASFSEEMYEVFLDRPFLYMIIDCENNMPVFMGIVNSVE